jgi:hypothetical protein
MAKSRILVAMVFALFSLTSLACNGDKPTAPEVTGRWVSAEMFDCGTTEPRTEADCSTRVTNDTVSLSHFYLQNHVFEGNAPVLYGVLSWSRDSATTCPYTYTDSTGVRCFVEGIFQIPTDNKLGITIAFTDPLEYLLEWTLYSDARGSQALADTTFTFQAVRPDSASSVTAAATRSELRQQGPAPQFIALPLR